MLRSRFECLFATTLPRGDKLCMVKASGCDLRSSDSYIISQRYFSWMVNAIINGGTVDYDVLPLAPGWGLARRPHFSSCP